MTGTRCRDGLWTRPGAHHIELQDQRTGPAPFLEAPFDQDAEEILAAAVILTPRAWRNAPWLRGYQFYAPLLGNVWDTAKAVDSIVGEFARINAIGLVTGLSVEDLDRVGSNPATFDDTQRPALRVRDAWLRRRLMGACGRTYDLLGIGVSLAAAWAELEAGR